MENEEICTACDGSGEGMSDGSTCRECGGSGEIAGACDDFQEPEEPDCDPGYEAYPGEW